MNWKKISQNSNFDTLQTYQKKKEKKTYQVF